MNQHLSFHYFSEGRANNIGLGEVGNRLPMFLPCLIGLKQQKKWRCQDSCMGSSRVKNEKLPSKLHIHSSNNLAFINGYW
jgi:hypothetical protein